MKKQTRRWLRGLVEAAISAASTSIAVLIVEPHMVSAETWWKLPSIAGASAFMAIVRKLQAEPLPPEDAPRPPRKPRPGIPPAPVVGVLLAIALVTSACGGKQLELAVAAQDHVHQALAQAQDRIDRVCQPGTYAAICVEVNGVLVHALRAARAFSQAVLDERLEGLGRVVEEVGRVLGAVRKFPPSALRDDIVAALDRAIDAAFKGAQ